MRIALAQINTTVGDFSGNSKKILEALHKARQENCKLIAFPELALMGYPPQDLLAQSSFIEQQEAALMEIAAACEDIMAVIGYAAKNEEASGKPLFNTAAVVHKGKIVHLHRKLLIPSYDIFDEVRYFEPGTEVTVFDFHGHKIALTVCEDIWNMPGFTEAQYYNVRPLDLAAKRGAHCILNISASPFHLGKPALRQQLLESIAKQYGRPVLYVNQVGANDALIFDGNSLVVDAEGKVRASGKSFVEDLLIVDLKENGEILGTVVTQTEDSVTQARQALVLGLQDYARKCGFEKAILGLSGGIDSALVAALATEALGPGRVWGVAMPSRYSSGKSLEDAQKLAKNLGIRFDVLPIEQPHQAFLNLLEPLFKGLPSGVAEENLQARLRGTLLMALSNKFGHLLLSTGNKSEMAVGYTTLYGDMNGGLALIGDVPKTLVYPLCSSFNAKKEIIPQSIFDKAPSAELRPHQKDQDTLPPYDLLDRILKKYIEDEKSAEEISNEDKIDPALVKQIIGMTDRAEYKRRQAPPTLRLTTKAFGTGRRLPIAQRFSPIVIKKKELPI